MTFCVFKSSNDDVGSSANITFGLGFKLFLTHKFFFYFDVLSLEGEVSNDGA